MDPPPRRWTSVALPAVMALVPFEPRSPTCPAGPFHVTLLEAVALAATGALGAAALARGRRRLRLPVALLAAFAAVELVSAAAADGDRAAALKFTLRMAFMAVFAAVVAAAEAGDRRRALVGLALGGGVASVLAILEGAGVRVLDPFLAAFREMPFNVAGVRRATAGSEYPNLGAAAIAYGLLAAVAAAGARRWSLGRTAVLAAPFAVGLLYTYSRGALLALAASLVVAIVLVARAAPDRARVPAAALATVALAAVLFSAGREVFQLRLGSEGVAEWYGARYEPEAQSLVLAPGGATRTSVRVTNTGLKTWTVEGQFHLSYHWYDVERRLAMDGGRTVLPHALDPGQSVSLVADVRAPGRPGSYLLLWDMVQEHTSWFSGQGVPPAAVPVTIGAASSAAAVAPSVSPPSLTGLAWRPGRGELWSLALGMWRAHPWLGVGPDRFRRLYGPWAGQAIWDDRVYANDLLLEVAATSGTIAAMLLVSSLGAGLWFVWRAGADAAAWPEAAAAGSLLAFVVVHGTVDYVLAFTGHYLVLAFAVGTAAALGASPASSAIEPRA
jgi:hypothetical protein